MEYVTLDYARFGFSNKRRAQKFAQNYANNRRIVELKLTNIFGFKVKEDIVSDISLYLKIEDQPYIVLNDGQVFSSRLEILYDKMLKKASVNV